MTMRPQHGASYKRKGKNNMKKLTQLELIAIIAILSIFIGAIAQASYDAGVRRGARIIKEFENPTPQSNDEGWSEYEWNAIEIYQGNRK